MIQVSTKQVAGGTVGRITLDRPDKKNALTPEMLERLIAVIGEVQNAGAIVLEGNGAAFCSGFDLSLCHENSDALRVLLTGLSGAIRALRRCEVPVVIAAHGAAIAGGCALLGGADVVITHHEAKIGYPVVRLGISPAISAPFLRQSIGDGRARERLLDSSLISGWDAFRIGLAHECMEDAGKVRDRAMAVAEQLAGKPRWGMAATKKWLGEIDGSFGGDAGRALDASLALVGSDEERRRLAAMWKS